MNNQTIALDGRLWPAFVANHPALLVPPVPSAWGHKERDRTGAGGSAVDSTAAGPVCHTVLWSSP
jgi:hypothetical protein